MRSMELISAVREGKKQAAESQQAGRVVEKNPKDFKKTVIKAVASVAVAAALLHYLDGTEGIFSTSVGSGEVIRIVPETMDVRALVVSGVETTAHYRSDNLVGKFLDVTHLSGCFGQGERFQGISGQGGGQIDSYVYAGAKGVGSKVVGDKQIITIPADDISLISKIDTSESELVRDNGICHDGGAFGWELVPWSHVSTKIEDSQGYLGSVAEDAAQNYAQTSCAQNVWPDTLKAITYAYQEIGRAQWEDAKTEGVNVAAFNPKNISVQITGGTPHYTKAYDIQPGNGYSYQNDGGGKCVEAVGALQLN